MNNNDNLFKKKKSEIVRDIIISFLLLCFCILVSFGIKMVPNYMDKNLLSVLWPRISLIFLLIFTLILLTKSLFEYYRKILILQKNININFRYKIFECKPSIKNLKVFLMPFFFCIMCYVFGSVFSIPIFVYVYMRFLGEKNIFKIIIVSLIADIFFIFLFGIIVGSPLPKGIGVFKDINALIY